MTTRQSRYEFYDKCKLALVPEIDDAALEAMLRTMRPVCRVNGYRFREQIIDGIDRRQAAYTWNEPRLGRPVQLYLAGLNCKVVPTFHTYGYYGFFKPSLAEVCACIRRSVTNWQLIRFFWLDTSKARIVDQFHECECHIFGEEEIDVIDTEWEQFVISCQKTTVTSEVVQKNG